MIHQGDQYYLLINVQINGQPAGPDSIEGLKIKVGEKTQTYPDGELVYDEDSQRWKFMLTQKHSLKLSGSAKVQIQVKKNGEIRTSDAVTVNIAKSIITEEWPDE